jgi:hypothetical protein
MMADESGETVRPECDPEDERWGLEDYARRTAERAEQLEDFRASELKAIRRQFEVRDYEPAPPEDWSWR